MVGETHGSWLAGNFRRFTRLIFYYYSANVHARVSLVIVRPQARAETLAFLV
jgi:hypothetical protein